MTWRLAITHRTGYQLQARGDVVVQRGPDHAALQRPPAGPRGDGRGHAARASPSGTGTTGARSSTPSTSTSPTPSCRSSGTSVVETSRGPAPTILRVGWSDLAPPRAARPVRRAAWRPPPTSRSTTPCWRRPASSPPGDARRRLPRPCWSGCEGSLRYEKGTTTRLHHWPPTSCARGAACARTSPTSPWPCCGPSASPPATSPATSTPRRRRDRRDGAGESHAWVEAWTGRVAGRSTPPAAAVGERHVVVGRARDYADVSPLKGIYHGGPAEALGVASS